jgi:hypothetical protein
MTFCPKVCFTALSSRAGWVNADLTWPARKRHDRDFDCLHASLNAGRVPELRELPAKMRGFTSCPDIELTSGAASMDH